LCSKKYIGLSNWVDQPALSTFLLFSSTITKEPGGISGYIRRSFVPTKAYRWRLGSSLKDRSSPGGSAPQLRIVRLRNVVWLRSTSETCEPVTYGSSESSKVVSRKGSAKPRPYQLITVSGSNP